MGANKMKIAVLSGKGGTGKTLVSVNLAAVAKHAMYVDCDVDEPNGHLFFKPEIKVSEKVAVKIPHVHEQLCMGCRKCVDFCKFNALAYIKDKVKVFSDVCHSCGGCLLICPNHAIIEKDKVIGVVTKGVSENVRVLTGMLDTGEVSGVPIIKKLLDDIKQMEMLTFIDCPPGSACIVMESIKDADYCLLVAEPTLFGAHNLSMVYELVQLFNKPHGVVLNKCIDGENPSELFCQANSIKIIGKIPYDDDLGLINSNALVLAREDKRYRDLFISLLQKVLKEAEEYETVINS